MIKIKNNYIVHVDTILSKLTALLLYYYGSTLIFMAAIIIHTG